MRNAPRSLFARAAVILLVTAAVAIFYLWTLRAGGYHFEFDRPQDGYYNYLSQAFANGHLDLPVAPEPALLAMPNPWDPAVPPTLKLNDAVLYNGRYYLYHGPGPAVMLFTPWKLLTGRDLPERFGIFLLCFGGFLFSCAALLKWLDLAGARVGPGLLAAALLALGLCQGIPYLLNRVMVYEIAIAGGYFSVCAAIFFLARSARSRIPGSWLAVSGLMFGMAIACRPHLGMAGVFAFIGLAVHYFRTRGASGVLRSKELFSFAFTFAAVGVAVAAYNYARFGNPFEFGVRYQLVGGPDQNRVKLAAEYVLPGLYYWLVCPPDISGVFPWFTLAFRAPFGGSHPFPAGYFIEPTAGSLYLAPFVLAAALTPLFRTKTSAAKSAGAGLLLWTALASSVGALLFLAATGFTTQRYEADFLPLAVLAAVAHLCIYISRRTGWPRVLMSVALALLIAWGAVVNMALGITGPYHDILKNRPEGYVRVARLFSPFAHFRPMLNPGLDVSIRADLASVPDKSQGPLVTMGRQVYEYFLYVERADGQLRLVSRNENSRVEYKLADGETGKAEIRVKYHPESREMVATLNGREALTHRIGRLVTAPAQVIVGANRADNNVTPERFPGYIQEVSSSVVEARR